MDNPAPRAIDSGLQSRQLATYGMSAMQRLAQASVLIIGINGLGVEVAKNIVLANVRKVTLADDCVASWSDMGTHFYLQPDDVGRTNRAEACFRSIKDVNGGVEVVCWTDAISDELLAAHDVVCVCDCVCRGEEGADVFKWNETCRSKGVSFIRCEARGVFGYVFDDFTSSGGAESLCPGLFSVPDPGLSIAHISNSNPAVVTIVARCSPDSLVGKTVRFSGIQGMSDLNDVCAVVSAEEVKPWFERERQWKFTLQGVDTSGMGKYLYGGSMAVDHRTEEEALTIPPFFDTKFMFNSFRDAWLSAIELAAKWPLIGDLGQCDHPRGLRLELNGDPNQHITRMLRAGFRTLESNPGRKISPGNEAEALALVDDICREIDRFKPCDFFFSDEFDSAKGVDNRAAVIQNMRPFLTTFAMSCAGSLSPVCACVGGIAAQEIIKSVARIDVPFSQFMFCSFSDILPKPLPTFQDVLPRNSRYDSLIAVLGARFHSELCDMKVRHFFGRDGP
jgi:ubiquitin-activating enzyme E1